jgi:hypothetical protein
MLRTRYQLWAMFLLLLVFAVGCSSSTAVILPLATSTGLPTSTVTLFSTSTLTPSLSYTLSGNCSAIPSQFQFHGSTPPLPPGTISSFPNSAAGTAFYIECTTGATRASIAAFFRSALSPLGWRQFNPATDQQTCAESNSYWVWVKGHDAIGYSFTQFVLPFWQLAECDRVNLQ